MSLQKGRDRYGSYYYKWADDGKKYHYKTEQERKSAKHNAIIQGYTLENSLENSLESSIEKNSPTTLTTGSTDKYKISLKSNGSQSRKFVPQMY